MLARAKGRVERRIHCPFASSLDLVSGFHNFRVDCAALHWSMSIAKHSLDQNDQSDRPNYRLSQNIASPISARLSSRVDPASCQIADHNSNALDHHYQVYGPVNITIQMGFDINRSIQSFANEQDVSIWTNELQPFTP